MTTAKQAFDNIQKLPTLAELREAYSQGSIYGKGGNANVYTIPNYPHLLLKVNSWRDKNIAPTEPVLLDQRDLEGRNFGHPIAQIAPGITILIKQHGVPAGIDARERKADNVSELYEASLKRAAGLPQQAYIEMVQDVQFLYSKNRTIDPSKPGNVLIDSESKSFNFVDITDPNPKPCCLAGGESLFIMLSTRGYGYRGQNQEMVECLKYEILNKLTTAYERLGLPWRAGNNFDAEKFIRNEISDPEQSADLISRLKALQNGSPPNPQINPGQEPY